MINIILKSNASGGVAAAQGGVTERGDGANVDLSDSQGFALGDGGRLTLSAEASYAGATNRAGFDQRFGAVDFRIGAPQIQNTNIAASGMLPIKALSGQIYDDLLASRKEAVNAGPFQSPGVSPIYPKGFLPKVNPTLWDVGDTLGLRGELPGKVQFDLSNTFGLSNADFHVFNTANVSLGLDSPTSFDVGSVQTTEDVLGLTFRRAAPELLAGGNVAAGFEYRHDAYRITAGSPASITGAGAQTFPGYNPRIPVDNGRDAEAAFLDAELKPMRWLSLGRRRPLRPLQRLRRRRDLEGHGACGGDRLAGVPRLGQFGLSRAVAAAGVFQFDPDPGQWPQQEPGQCRHVPGGRPGSPGPGGQAAAGGDVARRDGRGGGEPGRRLPADSRHLPHRHR